jgi:hypothetical protein
MPSTGFYNKIRRNAVDEAARSDAGHSDLQDQLLQSIGVLLPGQSVEEQKKQENTSVLVAGSYGLLTSSKENNSVQCLSPDAVFPKGASISSQTMITGGRYDCNGDGPAVQIDGGGTAIFMGARVHRDTKGGSGDESRHISVLTGNAIFIGCTFTGTLGNGDKIAYFGPGAGAVNAIGCKFMAGADTTGITLTGCITS